MSKIIEVYRHFNLVEMSQEDPSVKAWLGEAFKPIGPYFEPGGKSVATGLTFEEQRIIMPTILGIEHDDKSFRTAVQTYFHELLTNIPKDGLKLEVGLLDDTKPLDKDNLPLVPRDYIIYRHLLKHPHVATDKADAERNIVKRFFTVDPSKVAARDMVINNIEDKAWGLYFKYKDDSLKVDQVLTMMGIKITDLKKDQKIIKLKEFASRNPELSPKDQEAVFRNFISVCEDPDLSTKFLVQELIGAKYLKKVGTAILIAESNESLGDDIEEVVHFLNNAKNSKTLNVLKAQYQFKVKKSKDFEVPKVEEVQEEAE